MKVDMPYLYRQRDRYGKERYYVRRHGRKRRVEGEFGTKAFWRSYRALVGAEPDLPASSALGEPGSLKWLCERYYQTVEFAALSARTQKVRRAILEDICRIDWHGEGVPAGALPFAAMRAKHVYEIMDGKAGLPEAANARAKAMRQLFKWARKVGHVETNPLHELEYVQHRSEGHHTWTVAEVTQYQKHHAIGTKASLALALLLFTGTRRGDVVRLGRQMERDGAIEFRTEKGGAKIDVHIPILSDLRREIDACPSHHLTYLVTEFGKPFTANGFGNKFRRWCNQAGLPHCSAHGLRKAGATIAAENGASAHELMAIFGWSTLKQAEGYTRKASRKKLSQSGMTKLKLAHRR